MTGTGVGVLGGMIGLGGAEFRLPLLIGLFGFLALQAVILNKAMSLMVVMTALPARLIAVPYSDLAPKPPIGRSSGTYWPAVLGRRSIRRRSWALRATTTVDADIRMAPTDMGSTNPMGARTPAASGTEMRL